MEVLTVAALIILAIALNKMGEASGKRKARKSQYEMEYKRRNL